MAVFIIKKQLETRRLCFFLFFIIISINLIYVNTNECKSDASLNNRNCFTQIFTFDHTKLRGGQFYTNQNGDLIIEYRDDTFPNKRIFYGIKQEGGNFFPTENGFFEYNIEGLTLDESKNCTRKHDSMSYFVLIPDEEDNSEKEYLFTVNPFKSFVELQDLKSEGNTRYTWELKSFINYNDDEFLRNETFLIGIKNNSEFFITFSKISTDNYDKDKAFYSIRFRLNSPNGNAYEQISYSKNTAIPREAAVATISIDQEEMFGYAYLQLSSTSTFFARFFEYNHSEILGIAISGKPRFKPKKQEGNEFFKSILLNKNYLAVMHYIVLDEEDVTNYFRIAITQINKTDTDIDFKCYLSYSITGMNLNKIGPMNDFIKLNQKRVCFISTEGNPEDSVRKLYLFLFDFYDNYKIMKMRKYIYDLSDYIFIKDISCSSYNGLLVLDATSLLKKENMDANDWVNYFSIFMIFGYPNRTNIDITKDISFLLKGSDNFNSNTNFVSFLYDDLTYENNIF